MIRHATFINSNTISVRAFSPGKFSGAVKRQPFTSLQFLRSLDSNFGTVIEPCQPVYYGKAECVWEIACQSAEPCLLA
jgi:hypothetical protein